MNKQGRKVESVDHLGNVFPHVRAMCAYHGVPFTTYYKRIRDGKSVEEALSNRRLEGISPVPVDERTDHLGQIFPSKRKMCQHWGVSFHSYLYRTQKQHWSKEKALCNHKVEDHVGNFYSSKGEMCTHWKIPSHIYDYRRRSGWTLEEALTTPVRGSSEYGGWKVVDLVYQSPEGERFYLCIRNSEEEVMTKAELEQAT